MRRGVALLAVLMLAPILLVLGMGYMSKQRLEHQSVVHAQTQAVACSLAEAGLEDARVKLEKDPAFPPPGAPEQTSFRYTEVMRVDGKRVGTYTVTVVYTLRDVVGQEVLLVQSEGRCSPNELEPPQALVRLTGVMDVAPKSRTNPDELNPDRHRWKRILVGGGF